MIRCVIAWVLLVASASAPAAVQTVEFDSSGSDTAAFALPAVVQAPVTQLRARFALPLTLPLPTFRLIDAGADGLHATATCLAPLLGDDVERAITEIIWNDEEATLVLDAPTALPRGAYRVIACDAALPGGRFAQDFTIDETPTLENPGFDGSLDRWFEIGLPGSAPHFAPDIDADGAHESGAASIGFGGYATPGGFVSAGCIQLTPLIGFSNSRWKVRLRHRARQVPMQVTVLLRTGFAAELPDNGCYGPGVFHTVSFVSDPAQDFSTFDSGWLPLQNFPQANLSISVLPRDTQQPSRIDIDDIALLFDTRTIFRDAFD